MDQRLLDSLSHASSFDLFQLMMAIQRILEDPARMAEVRKKLHVGMQVQYFNQHVIGPCRVVEFRKDKVAVQDVNSHKHWLVPYAAILIDDSVQSVSPTPKPVPLVQVDRNSFQVGDTVGFTDKYLNQRVGKVVRRNEKTVTVYCDGDSWRVPWRILTKIIDV